MRAYVKRPIPIHAFQWDDDLNTLKKNVPSTDIKKYFQYTYVSKTKVKLKIKSLEGTQPVPYNDYIIRGIRGEYYPCANDIFKKSYKPIKEN